MISRIGDDNPPFSISHYGGWLLELAVPVPEGSPLQEDPVVVVELLKGATNRIEELVTAAARGIVHGRVGVTPSFRGIEGTIAEIYPNGVPAGLIP